MKENAWECSLQFICVHPQSPFITMLLRRELYYSHHKLFSKKLSESKSLLRMKTSNVLFPHNLFERRNFMLPAKKQVDIL